MATYELVTIEGKELRKYPDGTIRNERGRIVTRTSESARLMIERRRIISMEAIAAGLKDGTGESSEFKALRKLTAKRAKVALEDSGRAGNDAYRQLLIAGQYYPERSVNVQGTVRHNHVPQLPAEYIEYRKRYEQQLIEEGEVIDDNEG